MQYTVWIAFILHPLYMTIPWWDINFHYLRVCSLSHSGVAPRCCPSPAALKTVLFQVILVLQALRFLVVFGLMLCLVFCYSALSSTWSNYMYLKCRYLISTCSMVKLYVYFFFTSKHTGFCVVNSCSGMPFTLCSSRCIIRWRYDPHSKCTLHMFKFQLRVCNFSISRWAEIWQMQCEL